MSLALSLLLIAAPQDDLLEAVKKGMTFPSEDDRKAAGAKSAAHKAVVNLLCDPEVWAEGLRRVDSRLGLWKGSLEVDVRFGTSALHWPAFGGGSGGKGRLQFDVDALAVWHEKAEEAKRKRKAGATFVVPPARLDAVVWHELTHCFGGKDGPDWLGEGAAAYVAGDPHFVAFFRHQKQKVGDVDAEMEHKYTYARGWAFFEWLDAEHGRDAVKKFAAIALDEMKPPAEAVRAVLDKDWKDVKAAERAWSAGWIPKLPVE